jgi:hypothetical protein
LGAFSTRMERTSEAVLLTEAEAAEAEDAESVIVRVIIARSALWMMDEVPVVEMVKGGMMGKTQGR